MKLGKLLISFVPLGLLKLAFRVAGPRMQKKAQQRSRELLAAWRTEEGAAEVAAAPSAEELAALLQGWGLDPLHVVQGSIPEPDLAAICDHLEGAGRGPIVGIHVGNFLGVSLAYVASRLKQWNPESVLISIDPDLTHRGIAHTERTVTRLLRVLSLQDMVVRVHGYSLAKAVSNDGLAYEDYDPFAHFADEDAPELQLRNLARLLAGRVDFVMLDGNHDADYLREEVDVCSRLLRPGGALFLDDISDVWISLKREFARLSEQEIFTAAMIGTRTGVLVKR